MQTTIVYMVAGLSSRFGGKIKQFAKVGPQNQTLIEYSIEQAMQAGFQDIVFIVGEKTKIPFQEMFGDSYKGCQVRYAMQTFDPQTRDKPWGTVDALVCAKKLLTNPFVICNGDDIYGEKALKCAHDAITLGEDVIVGYYLGDVMPSVGSVNRGIIREKNGLVVDIQENYNISIENLSEKNLTEKSVASMNLFGFQPKTMELFAQQLASFKKENPSRTAECLLPVELGKLIQENKISVKLEKTHDQWFGVTNPEDEQIVRELIAKNRK
ncbi:MAG: nucleotidyltransferase family protein [Candidatus Woesearchaeota archaeon]